MRVVLGADTENRCNIRKTILFDIFIQLQYINICVLQYIYIFLVSVQ